MPSQTDAALIPIEDLSTIGDVPKTLVALDVAGARLVGTVVGWSTLSPETLLVAEVMTDDVLHIQVNSIVRGYWAPAGYRP